jgi:hypothetical protein
MGKVSQQLRRLEAAANALRVNVCGVCHDGAIPL